MIEKKSLNPARLVYYLFLSRFFLFLNSDFRYQNIKELINIISKSPINENVNFALDEIYDSIKTNSFSSIQEEYDEIFNSLQNPIRNTASFYLSGFESGQVTLKVKNILAKTNFRRNEEIFKENEDSVGFLLRLMHELIQQQIKGKDEYYELSFQLFNEIINPFIDTFIKEVFTHKRSNIYKEISIIFQAFMDFERLYYELEKPELIKTINNSTISKAEQERREKNKAKRIADNMKKSCPIG